MGKLQRNYSLQVTFPDKSIYVGTPPVSLEFNVTRQMGSIGTGSLRLYNLNLTHRNLLRKDISEIFIYTGIELKAGYGNTMPVILKGNIRRGFSVRESTSFITNLECMDGGFAMANSEFGANFAASATRRQIAETVLGAFSAQNVRTGKIGALSKDPPPKGNVYSGPTQSVAREVLGAGFFIDNEVANYLGDNECLPSALPIINSNMGLLGTPVREKSYLTFDMFFEPRLKIADFITLKSATEANFSGEYKVVGLRHRGMVSETVCGDAITSVRLWAGTSKLGVVL